MLGSVSELNVIINGDEGTGAPAEGREVAVSTYDRLPQWKPGLNHGVNTAFEKRKLGDGAKKGIQHGFQKRLEGASER